LGGINILTVTWNMIVSPCEFSQRRILFFVRYPVLSELYASV
jgi:hypothetical protein